jgi:hypothetical protein
VLFGLTIEHDLHLDVLTLVTMYVLVVMPRFKPMVPRQLFLGIFLEEKQLFDGTPLKMWVTAHPFGDQFNCYNLLNRNGLDTIGTAEVYV